MRPDRIRMTVRQGHGVGDNLFQDLNQAIIKLSKMILQPLYSDYENFNQENQI